MKPALFDMARPATLDDALALLADNDDCKILAGGQSLVPVLNFRLSAPALLIDLNRIDSLQGVRLDDGRLHIGAMTRQQHLLDSALIAEHAPLLRKALGHVGHIQTRSRGTIGGSAAHADPSAEIPLVLVALDAVVIVRSRSGQRQVAARAFFTDAMTTDLAADEMIVEIVIPSTAGARVAFAEIARRHGDFAIVAVAACRTGDAIAVAVGGLEATPRYCAHVSGGLSLLPRADIAALVREELSGAQPLSDLQAGADYRMHLAATLLDQVCREIVS